MSLIQPPLQVEHTHLALWVSDVGAIRIRRPVESSMPPRHLGPDGTSLTTQSGQMCSRVSFPDWQKRQVLKKRPGQPRPLFTFAHRFLTR
jgi:hypothetical protein